MLFFFFFFFLFFFHSEDGLREFISAAAGFVQDDGSEMSSNTSWGGRVVRWCWVNFQCRGVLQF